MNQSLEFIGKNIRFFRKSRNWTLARLASKISIQEGPLGRIERGGNLPSAAVIYSLTKALDVSADALFAPDQSQASAVAAGTDAVFITIEQNSPLPPKQLFSACRKLMATFHTLEDILEVQKHALVPLSIPFEPDYVGMEQLATQIRAAMGTGDAVIFDYLELFENFGLRILLFPFMKSAKNFEALSFYEPIHQNAFFFINTRKTPEKQLFSLVTELGKILIFNQMRIRKETIFVRPASQSDPRPINSIRAAKHFSATFLLPKSAVHATVAQLGISPDTWTWELVLRIKHRFGISAEAFVIRLLELNLITKTKSQNLITKIKAHYTRTNDGEPDDSRRILNANGRFFDLLLTASQMKSTLDEIIEINAVVEELNLVKT